MHKSYQSILPTHNKLLQKRWDQKYYQEHRQKVSDNTVLFVFTFPIYEYMPLPTPLPGY